MNKIMWLKNKGLITRIGGKKCGKNWDVQIAGVSVKYKENHKKQAFWDQINICITEHMIQHII